MRLRAELQIPDQAGLEMSLHYDFFTYATDRDVGAGIGDVKSAGNYLTRTLLWVRNGRKARFHAGSV